MKQEKSKPREWALEVIEDAQGRFTYKVYGPRPRKGDVILVREVNQKPLTELPDKPWEETRGRAGQEAIRRMRGLKPE